jgi:hypothetical protein
MAEWYVTRLMPLAFPSHQGLILPLWKWAPRRIDGVALSVGAAMPDIVDACAWPFRGELGQWMGHSLIGCVIACVPGGLALTWLFRRIRLRPLRALVTRLDQGAGPNTVWRAALSVGIGALSHDATDLVTHCSFPLLWPKAPTPDIFPQWWCRPWASVPVFVYKQPYPLAPHTIVWFLMTILGAWLFFRCIRAKAEKHG